ncbi:MAG: hypothetical protein EXR48_06885 [Dehalococcoidia bacterium]|nr:hypothetical protein [Dehalococcoidia bacterium]
MRYLVKIDTPTEAGNAAIRDPKFGAKMETLLKDIKAETAYFTTTVNRHRGGYIVINMDDASQILAVAEPLFHWLKATVEFIPVMLPQDLAQAGPAIQKWG